MKQGLKILAVLSMASFFILVNQPSQAAIPILRIGISLDCKSITLNSEEGMNLYKVPSMEKFLSLPKNHACFISVDGAGIKINERTYSVYDRFKVVSESGGLLAIDGKKYRGEFEIIIDHNLMDVINIIGIEKYLYGVLQKEISPEWPEEVLKAQAIAARTFALSNANKYIEKGYNICATTNSQAYGGFYHEHPATNRAVDRTKGIVISYQGKPINAVYHSDSGGNTENSENVWGGYEPYLRSVPSTYEEKASPPNHFWDYSLTEKELLTKLIKKGYQINHIDNMIISEKTETGRVKSIDILFDRHQKINFKVNDFRLFIGPTLIRSSLFDVYKIGGNLEQKKVVNSQPEKEKEVIQKSVQDILEEERDFSIAELIQLLNRPEEKEQEKEKDSLPQPQI
ncbi:MAG: SpoIID/LytB domain-containing protein, partial [Candidatus Atribacteria bacterium]|nr:SpoIID/LytB domain-containing protein [Candidatus Atribacteria bacterium]